MYTLTLTCAERKAIDFVGYRYSHGSDLYTALCGADCSPEDANWDDPGDITFNMCENVAWEVADCINEDELELLSDDFKLKLLKFAEEIV